MKKHLLLLLVFFSTYAFSQDYSKPLNYTYSTSLSSKSVSSFNFTFTQQIDLQCKIDSISPIDQSPEKMTITFKRIQGKADYNDKKLQFDSRKEDDYSLEFQSLKKLLNQPIAIELNRDMTLQRPIKSFDQLLHLSSLENHFINYDLLEQLLEAIFIPLKATSSSLECPISIYFPFKTTKNFPLHLKESSSHVSFHIDQGLELEGLYSTQSEPFSIYLSGKVKVDANWQPISFHTQRFSLSHDLKEKKEETLFENPLLFDYSIDLNLTKFDG